MVAVKVVVVLMLMEKHGFAEKSKKRECAPLPPAVFCPPSSRGHAAEKIHPGLVSSETSETAAAGDLRQESACAEAG